MANLNFTRVVIGGRLTADPELKTTPNGTSVCQVTVAVNNPGKDAGTSFYDVVAWRGTAELLEKYFHKGSSICVDGKLTQRRWTDNNGNKRSVIEINADTVNFVDSRDEAPKAEAKPEPVEPNWDELGDGEELPF